MKDIKIMYAGGEGIQMVKRDEQSKTIGPAKDWDFEIEVQAESAEATFNWCLENARRHLKAGRKNNALQWCSLAARFISGVGFFGILFSPELENIVREAASGLDSFPIRKKEDGKQTWIHIFSEAYAILGHTKLCRLWIENDSSDNLHSVVITSQAGAAPENLRREVECRGGKLVMLDPSLMPLVRAVELRKYVNAHADVVVLHLHPDDVVALAALSTPGGPPVVFVNHADHSFWVGASVADIVFDIRDSGHFWTLHNRGIARARIVPIPLGRGDCISASKRKEKKAEARKNLGLPEKAIVLLTIGSGSKYSPIEGLDFLIAAGQILGSNPDAHLLAVGPKSVNRWKKLGEALQGRLRAVGIQFDLTDFHDAADIYLEGFPTGSLTAMLEAGLAGLPCVRAPKVVPLPNCSDGVAFDEIERASDVEEYVSQVQSLINNPSMRHNLGKTLQTRVSEEHCGASWLKSLKNASRYIPVRHSIYRDLIPVPIAKETRNFVLKTINASTNSRVYERLFGELLTQAFQKEIFRADVFKAHIVAMIKKIQKNPAFGGDREERTEDIYESIKKEALSKALKTLATEYRKRSRRGKASMLALHACWHNPRLISDSNILKAMLFSFFGETFYQRLKRFSE